jgi:molybdopterin synthase catalytic subunit
MRIGIYFWIPGSLAEPVIGPRYARTRWLAPRNDGESVMGYISAMTVPATVRLQCEPFDAAAEARLLTRGRSDIGAVVTFTGVCRGAEAGEPIAALTLEHYPGMAEAEIERHVQEATKRWPLLGVTVIHRYGRIVPGEDIVMVVTASSHREAAFAAAEFLMDYLKTRAPFWKQVEKAGEKTWVEAKATDDAAAGRWALPRRGREAAE